MTAECTLAPQERLLYDSTHQFTLWKFRVAARRTTAVQVKIMRDLRAHGCSSKNISVVMSELTLVIQVLQILV